MTGRTVESEWNDITTMEQRLASRKPLKSYTVGSNLKSFVTT